MLKLLQRNITQKAFIQRGLKAEQTAIQNNEYFSNKSVLNELKNKLLVIK